MADMNIRGVDGEFLRAVKAEAALRGMTLRAFVLAALGAVGRSQRREVGVPVEKLEVAGKRPEAPVLAPKSSQTSKSVCSECFALGGMHARGCARG